MKIILQNYEFQSVIVELPKTTLYIIKGKNCFIMCKGLFSEVYDCVEEMQERKVNCARIMDVKSVNDLLYKTIDHVTIAAYEKGARVGMIGKDALLLMEKND